MPLKSIPSHFFLPQKKSTCTCPPNIIELQFNQDIRKKMLKDILWKTIIQIAMINYLFFLILLEKDAHTFEQISHHNQLGQLLYNLTRAWKTI